MRWVTGLATYVGVVLLAGAVLAYPLHWLTTSLGLDGLAFPKLALRTIEFLALLGAWGWLRSVGLRSRSAWNHAGSAESTWRGLAVGFVGGVVMLGVLASVLLLVGVRKLDDAAALAQIDWPRLLLKVMVSGAAVAVIEELWFRGALHAVTERLAGPFVAMIGVAILYAAVHFIRADVIVAPEDVDWASGFTVIANGFHRFTRVTILDSFVALLAAGLLLGVIRQRRGRIAECIGLHAGWVVVIKIVREGTSLERGASSQWMVGQFDGVIGWAAAAWFAILAALYYRFGPATETRDR